MADREGIGELVALVERLEKLIERSGLAELEVEHRGTTIVLRTPAAVAPAVAGVATPVAEASLVEAAPEPLDAGLRLLLIRVAFDALLAGDVDPRAAEVVAEHSGGRSLGAAYLRVGSIDSISSTGIRTR